MLMILLLVLLMLLRWQMMLVLLLLLFLSKSVKAGWNLHRCRCAVPRHHVAIFPGILVVGVIHRISGKRARRRNEACLLGLSYSAQIET